MDLINSIRVRDQYRIIHNPKNEDDNKIPQMPLLIVLNNGIIGESKSIRGAATIVIGNEYLDAEDALVEWHMRVETARNEAMKSLQYGVEAVVYDTRKGILPNNFVAGPNDPDYKIDEDEDIQSIEKIIVNNDRLFLLSLAKIGAIRILERADSYLFRPHDKWTVLSKNGGETKNCSNCLHKINSEDKIICPVYKMFCNEKDGTNCESFAIIHGEEQKEYPGGEYIDIFMEYGVDELIQMFGDK